MTTLNQPKLPVELVDKKGRLVPESIDYVATLLGKPCKTSKLFSLLEVELKDSTSSRIDTELAALLNVDKNSNEVDTATIIYYVLWNEYSESLDPSDEMRKFQATLIELSASGNRLGYQGYRSISDAVHNYLMLETIKKYNSVFK